MVTTQQAFTPKTTATRQFAGLVLAPVNTVDLEKLRAQLKKINDETQREMREAGSVENPIVPFAKLKTVHYARLLLIEAGEKGGDGALGEPMLAWSTNYDGPEGLDNCDRYRAWPRHLDEVIAQAGPGLESVFKYCEGYTSGGLRSYFNQHRVPAKTFYAGTSGRSRSQIVWEDNLSRRISKILDDNDYTESSPDAVRQDVRERLAVEYPAIPPFPPQPKTQWVPYVLIPVAILTPVALLILVAYLAWGSAVAVAITEGLVVLAGLAVLRFRYLERTDLQLQHQVGEKVHKHFEYASAEENEFLQNQLTTLSFVKPGPVRWLLIRLVFFGVDVVATYHSNKGKLGGIPSIHFARWSMLPNGGVLFFSNFDASWQSYLGDFVDREPAGLTAVWSNTRLYPRSRWLWKLGARDALRFLEWTRSTQRPTQVWYAAYPGLSVANINDNTKIRRGLASPDKIEASRWLFRMRGTDRVAADKLYGLKHTRQASLPLRDIQGIVLRGYGHRPHARFLMFRVKQQSPEILTWLSKLDVTPAAHASSRSKVSPDHMLNVAFSYDGLIALGLEKKLCNAFSTPFVQGSHDPYRARKNGDCGASDPAQWTWGNGDNAVHIMLLIYAKTEAEVVAFAKEKTEQATRLGLHALDSLHAHELPGRKEHFGFRDGIGQPIVRGSGRTEVAGNTVAAGEFLLGHSDGYGNLVHSPISRRGFNFGLNGSYLVFRQLRQEVAEFWKQANRHEDDAVTVASKMVGRWPSGAPLLRHPHKDPKKSKFQNEDNFSYLAGNHDNDRYGARTPFGSHVRRSNPRDWGLADTRGESLRLSNLHRLIRRGRPYGPPLVDSMDAAAMVEHAHNGGGNSEERGLQFLCFNANLTRQFEFVQQNWCNNPKFAGLESDPDPVLGVKEEHGQGSKFTIQSNVEHGLSTGIDSMKSFVTVVGSSYLFVPSIPAMKLLDGGLSAPPDSGPDGLETIPPDEQLHTTSLIKNLRGKMKREYLGKQMLRDAHPKMHGCVKATFTVEELPDDLKVGLFAKQKTYDAWVRFSNQDGTASRDHKKDIRGVAIKLMGVDGTKLLDGHEQCETHDLILITAEKFVTKDVKQFDGLVAAVVNNTVGRFFVRHWRAAWNLWRSLRRHTSLLNTAYFSVAPYLFGSRAVKYKLQPQVPDSHSTVEVTRDYLRTAMQEDLHKKSVSFDFMVLFRDKAKNMPIEDPGVRWKGKYRKVATLTIPMQTFDTDERKQFGEALSYNPWRCLPEHRPLGGISRARRHVYRALSRYRHEKNGVDQNEPS